MKKIFSFVAAMVFALAANAAVINIDATNANSLRAALTSAATGDEIVMAAGTYSESGDYLAFTGKEVTVRAAEGAEVIIRTVCPVRLKEGAKAEFVNVKFDCSTVGDYDYVIVAADDTDNKRVVLTGCEFYGWTKNKAMIEATSSRRLAAITINNCYFHDCMKSVVFIENTGSINLSITNSTFANITTNTESFWAGVIDSRATSGSVLVDHCTFYNVLAMNTDYAAVGKCVTPGAVVSNCIFMLPASQDGIRAIRDVSAAVNCLTFNYLKDSGRGIHSDVTRTNCVQADPLFVDAANGNFKLGEGSPALTMNDGQPIGDPRWNVAAPAKPTVAIAGSMNSWSAEANVMTEAEDGLSASCTINLTDWYYEFKVVVDGAWLSLNGDGDLYTLHRDWNKVSGLQAENSNFKLTPDVVPGDYTFKWTYATGELEIIFPEKPMPVVALAGDMNSWNAEANVLTMAEDSLTASVTVALEAGNYDFKMVVDGHWLAKDATYEVKRDWTMVDNVNQEISMGPNMKLIADMAGDYTFTWEYATNNLTVTFPALPVVYNWSAVEAEQVGTTILGNTDETITTVKIHENKDDVNCIKFGKSYSYADGKYIAIKPAEGGFKAGDILSVAVVFNNSDATKYCMIDLRAADGDTRIWLSDSASTINGRTAAGEPIVQTYTLEADQDSLFIGRYGNTGMCITLLNVVRTASETPELDYYLVGSMNNWAASEADKFAANPDQEGEYVLLTSLTEGATLKVVDSNNHWYPAGSGNDYTVPAELAGLVTVYFRPAGNADWVSFHEGGYIYIATREPGTGIDNTEVVKKAVKMIENGQLIIIKNGVRYNVMGIMVK